MHPGRAAGRSALRACVLAGATFVAVAGLLRAQAGGLTPEARCDPLAAPAQAIPGVQTLFGEMRVERGAPPQVQRYARLLLRTLAYGFSLPSALKLAVWGGAGYLLNDSADRRDPAWVSPDLPLGAFLIINRSGTLRRVVLAQSALVPALDSAVLERVQAAVDTAVLPAVLLDGVRDSVVLFFETSIRRDSSRGLAGLDSGTIVQPLARVQVPAVRLERLPRLTRGSARLDYPRRAGKPIQADGQVRVQFTVDADGRVAPGSLRLRDGSSPEFVEVVYEAVLRQQFEPALSGGCPLALVVDEAFSFKHYFQAR